MSLEHWHALDAPFTNPADWWDALIPGICTACGQDAWHGLLRWWHVDIRQCPDGKFRPPGFSPDL